VPSRCAASGSTARDPRPWSRASECGGCRERRCVRTARRLSGHGRMTPVVAHRSGRPPQRTTLCDGGATLMAVGVGLQDPLQAGRQVVTDIGKCTQAFVEHVEAPLGHRDECRGGVRTGPRRRPGSSGNARCPAPSSRSSKGSRSRKTTTEANQRAPAWIARDPTLEREPARDHRPAARRPRLPSVKTAAVHDGLS
jgi:hypothetical protein